MEQGSTAVELHWIPLGAGSPTVQRCGRAYERLSARRHHRQPAGLYHAALTVTIGDDRFTIEQTPTPDGNGEQRGVVASGPVGLRALGRWRLFRYEVRCWRNGTIPDLDEAVGGPIRASDDRVVAERVIDVVGGVPTFVWGRDEAHTGEMWNSNSVIAWTLASAGVALDGIAPPAGGRAPGWVSGRIVATAGGLPSRHGGGSNVEVDREGRPLA